MRILAVLIAVALSAHGEGYVLAPASDSYTIPAGGCYGTEIELLLANKSSSGHPDERSMIFWDLSEYAGRTVLSAVIRIDVFFQCGSGSGTDTEFFAATGYWDESWSGAHVPIETSPSGEYFFLGNGWHEIEASSLVQRWLSEEIPNYGVVFRVNGVYPYTKCRSRETTSGPELVLELEDNHLEPYTWAGIKSLL